MFLYYLFIIIHVKFNYKLKINPKMLTFKNLEKFDKHKKFKKNTNGNPVKSIGEGVNDLFFTLFN